MQGSGTDRIATIVRTGLEAFSWLEDRRRRRARLRRLRQLRWRHRLRRLGRAVLAATAILILSIGIGLFGGGMGLGGLFLTVLAMLTAFVLLAIFPRPRAPTPQALLRSDLPSLAGRTEAWLEAQRELLPAGVQHHVDRIGAGIEQLSLQLPRLDEGEHAAHEVRRLLGEHLPALIESYTRIPEALRRQPHAGDTPTARLSRGLDIIAREIEIATRQVARGELDALAIRGRYLETRYADAGDGE